jgi:3-oxoacyl-[acyl-carrier protein] reductase
MKMSFDGQVVVVTGASRGIGRAIAQAFADSGARVACVATTLAGAQAAAAAIGEAATGFAADVSDSGQVAALFKEIDQTYSQIDVLVNNAGITRDTLVLRMKDEDWDRVIAVNLRGTFLCTRAVLKPMIKARYGRIINVTSIIGQTGAAGQANYAASKAGVIGFTKSIAKEWGPRGVTCNAVAPGFIETDMTADLSEDFRKHVTENAPAGRLGAATDISNAVLFLAAKETSYVTGQVLTVDGGLTL